MKFIIIITRHSVDDKSFLYLDCLRPFPDDPDDSAGDREYGSSSDETR